MAVLPTFCVVVLVVSVMYIPASGGIHIFDVDLNSPFRNTTNNEQYATVLVSSNVVPSVSIGVPFVGILYFTVRDEGALKRVFSTVWHNVEEVVTIMLHGPAGRGDIGDAIFSLVPIQGAHVVQGEMADAGGGVSQPFDSPVHSSFLVDAQTLSFLRAGFLYVQIEAVSDPAIKLRGQVESRNDVYLGFAILPVEDMGDYYIDLGEDSDSSGSDYGIGNATGAFVYFGISLLQLEKTNNQDRAVLNSWTILCCLPDETLLLGIDETTGVILNTFGTLPQKPPEHTALVIFNDTSIRRDYIIRQSPVFGPDSSRMALAYQSAGGLPVKLGEYVRMPLVSETTDPDFGGRVPPDTVSSGPRSATSTWWHVAGPLGTLAILLFCVVSV